MKEEEIKRMQKQYHKLYMDTAKHCNDIEKWVQAGNRKQGDIRRSLWRLTNKYENLCELANSLGKDYIPEEVDQNKLSQLKDKVKYLYDLTGVKKQTKTMYDDVELVSDINNASNAERQKRPYMR